jgi:hypothetical protein
MFFLFKRVGIRQDLFHFLKTGLYKLLCEQSKIISFTKKTECDRPKRFDLSQKIVMPIVSLNHLKR